MSIAFYEEQYQQTLVDLVDLQQEDAYLSAMRINNDARTRNTHFHQYWLSVYLRYLRLSRHLTQLHDSELQPQKLYDVRTLLNSCIGRMLEAKQLITQHCGDFISLDNQLLDLKLSPEQAETPIPSYILEDRADELQQRRRQVLSLQAHYQEVEPEAPVTAALRDPRAKSDPSKAVAPLVTKSGAPKIAIPPVEEEESVEMSLEEAVRVLQANERGRQARQRAAFQLATHRQHKYSALHSNAFNTVTGSDRAATVVQKVVQGYLERKRARQRYEAEKRFLGMVSTEHIIRDDERIAAELRAKERKSHQRLNLAELRQKRVDMEERLKATEGPKTMEAMLDEVLMHMAYARMESRDNTVLELPPPEEGGSLKMLNRLESEQKNNPPQRRSVRSRSSAGSQAAGWAASEAAASTAAPSEGRRATSGASRGGGKGRKEEDLTEPLPPSAFWASMVEGSEHYAARWRPYYEQTFVQQGDLDQRVDEREVREELLQGPRGIISELRQCVDQLVMMEVANLKARLEFEKNAKRKKKKGKRGGKKRKPRLRDPTKGVPLETSLNTAVYENKLQLPPDDILLSHFVGLENTLATPLDHALRASKPDDVLRKKWQKIIRNWNGDVEKALRMKESVFTKLFEAYLQQSSWLPDPSPAQLRRAVTEYGVLPLGSQVIHDLAPHSKSLFFYGFPGTGKTMMAYALCNESGANFFNLSPSNFSTMKGSAKMIQLIFYLARMKGPSVIYIDGIEKIFPGKRKGAAKARKRDPLYQRGKKMKKQLLKGLHSIQPTDRVLLLGVSSEPWQADAMAIATHFTHGLYFPTPDYANRTLLLKHFINDRVIACVDVPEKDTRWDMNASAYQQVTLLTDGWSAAQLRILVERTLHPRRVEQLLQRPLDAADFVPVMSTLQPPSPEERTMLLAFQEQLPYQMRRANPPEDFKETEEEAKKRKSGSKKRKLTSRV